MKPDLTRITAATRRALEDGIFQEMDRLAAAAIALEWLDQEVYEAGLGAMDTPRALGLWLVQPAYLLHGRVPVRVLAERAGRKEVLDLLRAWARGDLFD